MEPLGGPYYTQNERMHEEIKARAYHFFEQQEVMANASNLDELKGELPRVAYSLSVIRNVGDSAPSDDRAYRAARIYLRALTSFVARG